MTFKVIDMHCDTITGLRRPGREVQCLRDNNMHISLNKMQQGNYLVQCFAVFIMMKHTPDPFDAANRFMDLFDQEMKDNADLIQQVKSYQDIMDLTDKKKMGGLLTIEEGGVLQGKIENLQHFYNRGVRMMTLTWNFENELAYPNHIDSQNGSYPDTEHGLKPFGIEVVRKMNELGMIVDVSHLSDAGIYDVLKYSTKPIVASHSNARAVCNVPRNLTDDMLVKLAENGGMTGINYCPSFISTQTDINQIPMIVEHIKHITNIAGIDSCGLGSDFDGISTPIGMSDCSKTVELYQALSDAGFTSSQLDKIFYQNFLRVFKANGN